MATIFTTRTIPSVPWYTLRPWPQSYVYWLLDIEWDTIIDVEWNPILIYTDPWYSSPTTYWERTIPTTTYSTRIIP